MVLILYGNFMNSSPRLNTNSALRLVIIVAKNIISIFTQIFVNDTEYRKN